MIIPSKYISIGGIDMSNQTYPSYFKPIPNSNNYKKGYIYRYFIQKINDLMITEVNKDKYDNIHTQYYNKIYIKWIITGPKNNQYKNKVLELNGVQEQNTQTLNDVEKRIKGIKNYLNNPLEFWNGK